MESIGTMLGKIQELQHAIKEGKAFLETEGMEFKIKKWSPAPDTIHGMAILDGDGLEIPLFAEINDCYVRVTGNEQWYDGLIKKKEEEKK